jgi:hypothetical protein
MDGAILAEMKRAWRESQADDPEERHEEGAYVVLNADNSYAVERWSRGEQFRIAPPPLDLNGCYNGKQVIATFHTHPNPPIDEVGWQWEQGPSEADRRWHVRRRLRGFVVSATLVYEIAVDGTVRVVGKRDEVLSP